MYFYKFPTIDYDVTGNQETTKIQDILIRIMIRKGIRERNVLFSKYDVKDWETPESVSHQFYGVPHYHWVVMMMNKMFSRYYDWPLSERALQAYALDKYTNPNDRHHYEIPQSSGDTTVKVNIGNDNTGHPTATAVTNLEYERSLNDTKKSIKILAPSYLGQFLDEHSKIFGNL